MLLCNNSAGEVKEAFSLSLFLSLPLSRGHACPGPYAVRRNIIVMQCGAANIIGFFYSLMFPFFPFFFFFPKWKGMTNACVIRAKF